MLTIVVAISLTVTTQPSDALPDEDAGGSVLAQVNLEAIGGMALTPMAYVTHAPQPGQIGRPVVSVVGAAGHDKRLGALTLTLPVTDRLEFGFSHQTMHLGSLRHRIRQTLGVDMGTHHVELDTLSAKLVLVPEGTDPLGWMPAIAVGAAYKHNPKLDRINKKLFGGLAFMGIDDDDGVDYTLTATRQFDGLLPTPLILSAGLRLTEANQTGFFGFTDGYRLMFEASLAWYLTDNLVMAIEYRQKPDRLRRFGSLYLPEDDWWGLFAAYQFDDHLSVGLGVANVGRVANSREPALIGLAVTYGF